MNGKGHDSRIVWNCGICIMSSFDSREELKFHLQECVERNSEMTGARPPQQNFTRARPPKQDFSRARPSLQDFSRARLPQPDFSRTRQPQPDFSRTLQPQPDFSSARPPQPVKTVIVERPKAIPMKQVVKPRNYLCTTCGQVRHSKESLASHFMLHARGRPYLCQICKRRFHLKENLMRHQVYIQGVPLCSLSMEEYLALKAIWLLCLCIATIHLHTFLDCYCC